MFSTGATDKKLRTVDLLTLVFYTSKGCIRELSMRIISSFLLTIITSLLIAFPAAGSQVTRPAFWSALTPFELKTLYNAEAARKGDPDTLLALALIASGDVRRQENYDRIKKDLHRFVKKIRPRVESQSSIHAKGKVLFNAMHVRYLAGGKNGQSSELISGYESGQSKVSTIFKNGNFNCISSAILYTIIARYFNLKVEGVVISQHAFVQIQSENGRFIEIETTSKKGYGLVHDKKFYEKNFTVFALSRDLAIPTYKDYLNRRKVTPHRFIVENMNHQHTSRARMNKASRYRLNEIRGYIDPRSPDSQLVRLNAYHNTCIDVLKGMDKEKINKLVRILAPVLRDVKTRPWIGNTQVRDIAQIRDRIGTIHAMLGHFRMTDQNFDEARHHFSQAYQWANNPVVKTEAQKNIYHSAASRAFQNKDWGTSINAYQKMLSMIDISQREQIKYIRDNIAAAYWNWGNSEIDRKNWYQAGLRYAAVEKWSQNPGTLKKAKSARARSNAMHYFNQRKYDQAIQFFMEELSYRPQSGEHIRGNIGTAYISWGNTFFNRKKYGAAIDKYEKALAFLPGSKKSLVYNNIAAAYHNMTIPLLRKRKVDQTGAILNSSLQRFPDCTPCREQAIKFRKRLPN